MLRPSYSELMDILNQECGLDDKITSSYAIVIAAAKRARQIVDGALPLTDAPTDKAVSIAVNEIYRHKIHIMPENKQEAEANPPALEQIPGAYYASTNISLGYSDEDDAEPDDAGPDDNEIDLDIDIDFDDDDDSEDFEEEPEED